MGFKDFLKRGSGLDLVAGEDSGNESDERPTGVGMKDKPKNLKGMSKSDEKVFKQLESEVSRAIEKLEDIRDRLRVRRGF